MLPYPLHEQQKKEPFGVEEKKMKSFEDAPVQPPAHYSSKQLFSYLKRRQPRVVLVLTRAMNKNVVVYEAQTGSDGTVTGVDTYWLILEAAHRQARRRNNILHDREDLTWLESTIYKPSFSALPLPTLTSKALNGATIALKGGKEPSKGVKGLLRYNARHVVVYHLHIGELGYVNKLLPWNSEKPQMDLAGCYIDTKEPVVIPL